MTTNQAIAAGREAGATGRILKFAPDGTFIKEWGRIGTLHGEFRTPHALAFDSQGRLFVADRGNHRIEIFDQDGNYLDSLYSHGRISGIFITPDDMLYSIDSESSMTSHANWMNGVRIGPVDEDSRHRLHPAVRRGNAAVPGRGRRRCRGRRGRQRVRRRGPKLAPLRGRRVHEVRGRLIAAKHSPGLVGQVEHFDMRRRARPRPAAARTDADRDRRG